MGARITTHTPPTGDAELNRAVANLQENEVPPPPEIEVTQKDREMWEKKASPEVIVSAANAYHTMQQFRNMIPDRIKQLTTWLEENIRGEFKTSAIDTFWLL